MAQYDSGTWRLSVVRNHLFVAHRYCKMIVGIDRTSKFAVTHLVDKADRRRAWEFLERLPKAVPYGIHTILADNPVLSEVEGVFSLRRTRAIGTPPGRVRCVST